MEPESFFISQEGPWFEDVVPQRILFSREFLCNDQVCTISVSQDGRLFRTIKNNHHSRKLDFVKVQLQSQMHHQQYFNTTFRFFNEDFLICTPVSSTQHELAEILKRFCIFTSFHDEFEVQKLIGKGSFAKVYLAYRKRRSYAIKCFTKQFVSSQFKGKQALINEVAIMRKLDFPTLATLYEVYETANSIYLVMELIDGGNLQDRMLKFDSSSLQYIQTIFKQLLQALEYMHRHNIAHRDLKPENILLKGKDQIVVADFGLAANLDEPLIFKRCGTPGYIAPEVINYLGTTYTTKADLFSVGVILYYVSTGRHPFRSRRNQSTLQLNMEGVIDYSERRFVELPLDLQDLIMQLLQVDPLNRPSAAEAQKHDFFMNDPSLTSATLHLLEFPSQQKLDSIQPQGSNQSRQIYSRKPAMNGRLVSIEDSLKNSLGMQDPFKPNLGKSRFNQLGQESPSNNLKRSSQLGGNHELRKLALQNSFRNKVKKPPPIDLELFVNEEYSDVTNRVRNRKNSFFFTARQLTNHCEGHVAYTPRSLNDGRRKYF